MDVLSFRTEIRRLIELRQEGEYWDFKKEWYQNKSDLLHDIICMATVLFARVKSSSVYYRFYTDFLKRKKITGGGA